MGVVEVRWHGRGGQGTVLASRILAKAAFYEGKWPQAFPFFGAERRGAPVMAFTRIGSYEIKLRSQVYEPDVLVIVDPLLVRLPDVYRGLKRGGTIVANTRAGPESLPGEAETRGTVDATGIALELGLRVAGLPVPNTAMVGAVARVTGLAGLDSVRRAIGEMLGSRAEENVRAAELGYERVRVI